MPDDRKYIQSTDAYHDVATGFFFRGLESSLLFEADMARSRAFLVRSDIERATALTDSLPTATSMSVEAGGGSLLSAFPRFDFFIFVGGAERVSSVPVEGPLFSGGSSIFRLFAGGDTTSGNSLDFFFFFSLSFFEVFAESDVGLGVLTSAFSGLDPEAPAANSFFFSAS